MPELAESMLAAHRAWFAEASDYPEFGTPPAIVIDFDVEPYHELNRNDWRPLDGGYGATGVYWIETAQDIEVDLIALSRSKARSENGSIRVWLNDVPVSIVDEIEVLLSEGEAVELPVGPIPIPAGQHQLRVEIRDERGLIPCDHLRVGPPGFAWL